MNKSNMNRRDDRSKFSKSDKGGFRSSSEGSFQKKSYNSDSSFPRDKGFDSSPKFNKKSSDGDSGFPQDRFKRSSSDSGFRSNSKSFDDSGKSFRKSGGERNFSDGPKKEFKSGSGYEFKKKSESGFSRGGDKGGFNRENKWDKKPFQSREGGDDRRNSFSGRSDDNKGFKSNFEFKKKSDSGFSGGRDGFKGKDDRSFQSREFRGEKKPFQPREGNDGRRNSFSGRSDDNKGFKSNFEFKKRPDSGFSGDRDNGGFNRIDDKPFFSRENRGDKKPFHAREKGEERRNSFSGRSDDQNGNKSGYQFKKRAFGDSGFTRDGESGGFNRGGEKTGFSRENRGEKRPFQPREGGDERRSSFSNKFDDKKGFRPKFDNENKTRSFSQRGGDERRENGSRYSRDENRGSFDRGFSKSKSKPFKGGQASATDGIRLNRFIANAGISSRREADELIQTGAISLNGEIVTEMGLKVMPGDEVRLNGSLIKRQRNVYFLMNKPKDYITTMEDPQGRKTVMELIESATSERIYPVGRLDRNTTGVLLFTNDGELTQKLTHPSFNIKKVYLAELDKKLTREDMKKIADGVELEDGFIKADSIAYVDMADQRQIGIEIHSGRNRIIHRIFEHLGYKVDKLDRSSYAGLTKKDLKRGQFRELTKSELSQLYSMK